MNLVLVLMIAGTLLPKESLSGRYFPPWEIVCNPAISCKRNVIGQNCDQCAPQHFGLSESDPVGCQPCNCDLGGAIDNECDVVTGQCTCQPGSDTGRKCDMMIVGDDVLPKESQSSKLILLSVLLALLKSLI